MNDDDMVNHTPESEWEIQTWTAPDAYGWFIKIGGYLRIEVPADSQFSEADAKVLHAAPRLFRERRAYLADLNRISAELGLPPGIGPADGEFKRMVDVTTDLKNRLLEAERRIVDLESGRDRLNDALAFERKQVTIGTVDIDRLSTSVRETWSVLGPYESPLERLQDAAVRVLRQHSEKLASKDETINGLNASLSAAARERDLAQAKVDGFWLEAEAERKKRQEAQIEVVGLRAEISMLKERMPGQ
mgnify:CR=1 FL=1